jgi:hypothetical protein
MPSTTCRLCIMTDGVIYWVWIGQLMGAVVTIAMLDDY